jgi:hypothetical protein
LAVCASATVTDSAQAPKNAYLVMKAPLTVLDAGGFTCPVGRVRLSSGERKAKYGEATVNQSEAKRKEAIRAPSKRRADLDNGPGPLFMVDFVSGYLPAGR